MINCICINLMLLLCIVIQIVFVCTIDVNSARINYSLPTRRILRGESVGDTRPYMVYLRPAADVSPQLLDTHWLCGGAIIHERYILTSAACIEDVKQFYVISGTHKFVSPSDTTNECVQNGAKRAIWKCVPKSYYFDGDQYDNIRWMIADIALVKVEDDFNFVRRVRGCDFVTKKIAYNGDDLGLEKSGTEASIAGWGTTDHFENPVVSPLRSAANSARLLETNVVLMTKKSCKKYWDDRYHFVIDDTMICTRDESKESYMGNGCMNNNTNCNILIYSDEDDVENKTNISRRMIMKPNEMVVHTAAHRNTNRRTRISSGGFCENDHGGPLIVGQGKTAKVIGVMSACLTKDVTNRCYGPFLYTSVYKYKDIIYCIINMDTRFTCTDLINKTPIEETTFDWSAYQRRASITTIAANPRTSTIQNDYKKIEESITVGNIPNTFMESSKHSLETSKIEVLAHHSNEVENFFIPEFLSNPIIPLPTKDPFEGIKKLIRRKFFISL